MPDDQETIDYRLDAQVGFLLRKANQRHLAIFAAGIDNLTPLQFASLAKLLEEGPLSQNALGRATAMDAATIKGVIGRLRDRGLVTTLPDAGDRRRLTVALTASGRSLVSALTQTASKISADTLGPLTPDEQQLFLRLLQRLT
ncbi:MAG: MarR family transcriptional regulator [Pseudomonadota bacterium]